MKAATTITFMTMEVMQCNQEQRHETTSALMSAVVTLSVIIFLKFIFSTVHRKHLHDQPKGS